MRYGRARECCWLTPSVENRSRWEEERNQLVIGSSDVGAIMEPGWRSKREQIRKLKLGQGKPVPSSYAMRRGHGLEPFLAREAQRELGLPVEYPIPYPLEHPRYTIIRVNIDAYCRPENAPIECKDANRKDSGIAAMLSDGVAPGFRLSTGYKIPSKWRGHIWQLQSQMFVLGAPHGYLAIDANKAFYLCKVAADFKAWKEMLIACRDFISTIHNEFPPAPPEPPEIRGLTVDEVANSMKDL